VIWEEIDDVEIEVEEFDDLFSKAPPKPKEVKVSKLEGLRFGGSCHSLFISFLSYIQNHIHTVHSLISIRRGLYLKVHKRDKFFGSDFELFTIL
jgi:hypothetical protein